MQSRFSLTLGEPLTETDVAVRSLLAMPVEEDTMLNIAFVVALALGLLALIVWGVRTLPAERWQMLAAVPIAKSADGSWRGLNLTFYGFFSATGTTFGFAIMLLLLASVGIPACRQLRCWYCSFCCCGSGVATDRRNRRAQAQHLHRRGRGVRRNHLLPLLVLALAAVRWPRTASRSFRCLPIFAAAAIAYVLGESVGRLACLSFGCCYGMPLREANPAIARLFQNHNLVIQGPTKKAHMRPGWPASRSFRCRPSRPRSSLWRDWRGLRCSWRSNFAWRR